MSSITGIGLLRSGNITFLPTYFLYLSSLGFTATAVSPRSVSGRVVAISKYLSLSSSRKYLI